MKKGKREGKRKEEGKRRPPTRKKRRKGNKQKTYTRTSRKSESKKKKSPLLPAFDAATGPCKSSHGTQITVTQIIMGERGVPAIHARTSVLCVWDLRRRYLEPDAMKALQLLIAGLG